MSTDNARGGPILGCDIGNGYGYVSLLQHPDADPMPLFPSKYRLSDLGMPTTAYITPPAGDPIVVFQKGKAAERTYSKRPKQLVRAVKTRLKEGNLTLPDVEKPVPVRSVYGAIARDLVALAQEELANRGIDPIYDLVFTFPAAMADDVAGLEQLQTSVESIQVNGHPLRVRGRLPEPAAVAIDYLHYMQHIAPEEIRLRQDQFTVLVYDLGHGTFDTAVVTAQSQGTPYRLHAKAGLPDVGGKDFDELLYQEFCRQLLERYQYAPKNERERQAILQAAIKAKFELTGSQTSMQSIPLKEEYYEVEVSQERFEQLSEHLMVQTLELVQTMLEDSQSNGIPIHGIVLSGGASKMPVVKRSLEQLVEGALPVVLYRPSEAVSYGAARFAYGIQPVADKKAEQAEEAGAVPEPNQVLEQLTDCGYGVWLPTVDKLEGEVRFLVGSGEKRPAVSEPVTVSVKSHRVTVKLYRSLTQNERGDLAPAEQCRSMLWFPFDVKPGETYQIRLTAREDYSVQVELEDQQGKVIRKTTSDLLRTLVEREGN